MIISQNVMNKQPILKHFVSRYIILFLKNIEQGTRPVFPGTLFLQSYNQTGVFPSLRGSLKFTSSVISLIAHPNDVK